MRESRVHIALAAAASLAVGSIPFVARADPRPPSRREPPATYVPWVIPAGQEPVVVRMLGGEGEITHCRFDDARVVHDRIAVTFECGATHPGFAISLRHRDGSDCDGLCTEKFDVEVAQGTPPDGFLAALGGSIRTHEGEFRWLHLARPRAPRHLASPLLEFVRRHALPVVGGFVLVLFVIAVLIERRRERTSKER